MSNNLRPDFSARKAWDVGLAKLTINDLAELREIILGVIDEGDPKCANVPWEMYVSDCIDEDKANAQRLDFCSAIQRGIQDTWPKRLEVVGEHAARAF